MSTLATSALISVRKAVVLRPQYRQPLSSSVSRVLLAATALSVLGSTRTMAASTAGQCANTGPIPRSIEGMASAILKVKRCFDGQAGKVMAGCCH